MNLACFGYPVVPFGFRIPKDWLDYLTYKYFGFERT